MFNFQTTGIGSLPHVNSKEALNLVLKTIDIPFWPQLPKKDYREQMYVQFSEGLPCLVVDENKFYIDTLKDLDKEIEVFYKKFLKGNLEDFAISSAYTFGLKEFLKLNLSKKPAIKGQITGPISFGLKLTDENKKPILYNEIYMDVLAKHLLMKAKWQVEKLKEKSSNVILFLDEPSMALFGSATVSLSKEEVQKYLGEVLNDLDCIKGIHCCANTDWGVLLDLPIDIISFDAYGFGESIFLYGNKLVDFYNRGGIVAWGIVPTTKEDLEKNTTEDLVRHLKNLWQKAKNLGVDEKVVFAQSLVTPSCGTGSLEISAAEEIFRKTEEIGEMVNVGFKSWQ